MSIIDLAIWILMGIWGVSLVAFFYFYFKGY
jgi:hypothetical protein